MAYNNLDDITFFERTTQERADIENICRNCQEFKLEENPKCSTTNNILVFSQLKKFHECPQGKW
jgi:hypothetical protein